MRRKCGLPFLLSATRDPGKKTDRTNSPAMGNAVEPAYMRMVRSRQILPHVQSSHLAEYLIQPFLQIMSILNYPILRERFMLKPV